MIAKNNIYVITLLLAIFSFSCLDRNNYKASLSSYPVEEENTMTSLLMSTFENVNDTVLLAYRGHELSTTNLIVDLYKQNQHLPIWTTAMKPNHDARELMRLFAKSAYYGLDTTFYQFSSLKKLYYALKEDNTPDVNTKALEYELLMSHNCFKIMSHMRTGVLDADTSIYGKPYIKYPNNFTTKLNDFINTGRITEGILALQPRTYRYIQLQKGMEKFLNSMNLNSDSFFIPDMETDSMLAYQKAKNILTTNNFYDPSYKAKEYANYMVNKISNFEQEPIGYTIDFSPVPDKDSVFIASLKKFQSLHGLHADGRIGTNTKNALLKTNRERFEQIAINMERLKWEKRKPARYVYVNLPAYKVRVVDKHMVIKTIDIVIGATWFKTPLFNSEIEYFTTNPRWYVPVSITKNELLPIIKKDSTYLKRKGYRVYDLEANPVQNVDWSKIEAGNLNIRLQQRPGRGNAMGKIKFFFDSGPYNVLLHDTNDKSKFKKEIRAYSHGCMRLAEPVEFGTTLAGIDNPSVRDSVKLWVDSGYQKRHIFSEPIPLYVRYVTCEADDNANIKFYYDIYGKDKELKERFFAQKNS